MDRSSKLINKNYSFISSSSTNIISYAGSQGRQLRIRTHGSISKKSLSCVWYISRMLQEMSAHNRRPRRHTAKTSPTVADGKARTVATGTAKTLFAVCIYRLTAKKSGQTPSRPADSVGGCSPCARTAGTRQSSQI